MDVFSVTVHKLSVHKMYSFKQFCSNPVILIKDFHTWRAIPNSETDGLLRSLTSNDMSMAIYGHEQRKLQWIKAHN